MFCKKTRESAGEYRRHHFGSRRRWDTPSYSVWAITGSVQSALLLPDLTIQEDDDAPQLMAAMTPRTGNIIPLMMEIRLKVY